MMRIHRHIIDYAKDKHRHQSGVVHNKGWFFGLERGGDGTRHRLRIQTILQKPRPEFSARLHVGGGWSETPFDTHLTILGSGVYLGIGAGSKLAEKLSRETRHKYEGRDISIAIHDGSLWWKVWTHNNHWESGEFAKWRDSHTDINPLDRVLGRRRYWYEDESTALIAVAMPEGIYPVKATLQRQKFGRPKVKKRTESWVVDVDAPKGIPYRVDHSGGWKGDRVYGFGVSLREKRDDWTVDAKAAIEAWVLRQRADTGFRKPDPVKDPA